MPIDPSKALGASISGGTASWDRDKVILYHLGVGAGVPQTDPNELTYTYEKDLKVVRAFPTIIAVLFPSDFRVFRGHSFCINLT